MCRYLFKYQHKGNVHYVKTKINDPSPPNICNDTLIGQLGEAKTSLSPVST